MNNIQCRSMIIKCSGIAESGNMHLPVSAMNYSGRERKYEGKQWIKRKYWIYFSWRRSFWSCNSNICFGAIRKIPRCLKVLIWCSTFLLCYCFLFFSCGEIFEITVKMEINLLITWWKLLIDTGIRHKKSAQKINDSQNLIIDSWKSLSAPAFELTQKFRLTINRMQRRPNPFENSVCTVIFESISAFFSASRSSVIDCRMSVQLMQMQIGIIARFTLNWKCVIWVAGRSMYSALPSTVCELLFD